MRLQTLSEDKNPNVLDILEEMAWDIIRRKPHLFVKYGVEQQEDWDFDKKVDIFDKESEGIVISIYHNEDWENAPGNITIKTWNAHPQDRHFDLMDPPHTGEICAHVQKMLHRDYTRDADEGKRFRKK